MTAGDPTPYLAGEPQEPDELFHEVELIVDQVSDGEVDARLRQLLAETGYACPDNTLAVERAWVDAVRRRGGRVLALIDIENRHAVRLPQAAAHNAAEVRTATAEAIQQAEEIVRSACVEAGNVAAGAEQADAISVGTDHPGPLGRPAHAGRRRRGQILALAGTALLAVVTAAVLSSLGLRPFTPPLGAPGDWPYSPSVPGGTAADGGPVHPGSRSPDSDPHHGPRSGPPMQAFCHTMANRLGYHGEITVLNNSNAVADWVVTLTIQPGAVVTWARGARFSRDGRTAVFTSEHPNQRLNPGETVTFRFHVKARGAAGPEKCEIEAHSCSRGS